jgi:uncharacterized protein YciI
MSENNFEIIKQELLTKGQGAILSKVLQELSPADLQQLKQKAAEGTLSLELEQLSKAHQFQASTSDMAEFISNVRALEATHRNLLATYKAQGTFKTATGTTTIESKKGFCYIATAVYKNPEHPNVILLKTFRDKHLATNKLGRAFIRSYYSISPAISRSWLCKGSVAFIVRRCLNGMCHLIRKFMH